MPPAQLPNPQPRASTLEPWRLWAGGASALLTLSAGVLFLQPDAEGARQLIRLTARLSLLLFLLTFVASACWRFWPAGWSAALVSHRRQVGWLFATSHACHALGIACLATWAEPALWTQLTPDLSRWVGGAGYVAVIAMTLTSFDGAVRWMGRARWQLLHRFCAHFIWLVFVLSCLKRVGAAPVYALPLGLLIGAMVLRTWPVGQRAASRQARG